jgi:HEAT repeat protein
MFWRVLFLLLLTATHSWGKEPLIQSKLEAPPLLSRRIQVWIEELEKDSYKAAQENLLRLGPIANPYLFQVLISPGKVVQKRRVIAILREMQHKSSVPVLLKCLENSEEDPRVREEAASALGMLPSQEVLEVLSKYAFHQDTRIYRSASYALLRSSGKTAIPYFLPLLKHWDKDVVNNAYKRLVEITGRSKAPLDFVSWQHWWNDYKDVIEE